ncbi:MAG: YggT family protein [Streptococcaceae bacterium]|nr:YggT family protein [Streptococcaceae bacterium]MCL2681639.1 YggT family protein [Streptococcaceae bacterium]
MSWVPSIRNSQIGQMITKISRPYLSIFDRLPLAIGGLDFTVVIAVISLQFIQRFIILIVG